MPRKRVVTQRPTYRRAVEWIALNDNAGDDDPVKCGRDGNAQAAMRTNIAGYLSTVLVADLFGADADDVAADVFILRRHLLQLKQSA